MNTYKINNLRTRVQKTENTTKESLNENNFCVKQSNNNNQTDNLNEVKESSSSDLYEIDAETLSRAILTFCLDGADAIMYALILGAPNACAIVQKLRKITAILCEKYESTYKNDNKQLKLILDETQITKSNTSLENSEQNINNENSNIYKHETQISKNYDSSTDKNSNEEFIKIIENNPHTNVLEQYFLQGLSSWGYKNTQCLTSTLHRSIIKWCMRLSHLPSWNIQQLTSWFTMNKTQWIISPSSPYWPIQLQDLALHGRWAPPLCLWGLGNPGALIQCNHPIAIVGSRGCDDYGHEIARRLAYESSLRGHTVISGGAMGIDAAAHWGSLESREVCESQSTPSGPTIAVFAGGLNNIGPSSNANLFEKIITNGGACISELCPNTTPIARRFLIRNRIIAALASKVIVAQARIRSGALNTACWATNLNRELYAIPGDITSPHNTGCNELIGDGKAIMICSFGDIESIYPNKHKAKLENSIKNKTFKVKNGDYSNTDTNRNSHDNSINDSNTDSNTDSNNNENNYTKSLNRKLINNCESNFKKETKNNEENYFEESINNNLQNYILHAIKLCKKRHMISNMDAVYNTTLEIIKGKENIFEKSKSTTYSEIKTQPDSTQPDSTAISNSMPSIAEFSGIITMLEINGFIKRYNDSLILTKRS